MKSTTELRQQIRAARRAVAPEVRKHCNSRICQLVSELDTFQTATRIAGYLAFDGEADPMELMVSAVEQGKQVYLPIVVGKSKPLVFAPWTPSTPMTKNRFNILEPNVDSAEWLSGDQIDFVVNPLVCFDEKCNRIGVGGGFYDRTFSFLNEPKSLKSVQLVGFAFDLQKLPAIKPEAWDIRLDAVVTQSNVYR